MTLLPKSFAEAIERSRIEKDAEITDKDIENIKSFEIPLLQEFIEATSKPTANRGRRQARKKKRNTRKR